MSFEGADRAACIGLDTDFFFDYAWASVAIATCHACPVLDACREFALAEGRLLFGVWGGLTHEDRKRRLRDDQREWESVRLPLEVVSESAP